MKIFVASWFFPPSTSSEGIVTYKLLRNSCHEYHVFSSRSTLWSYSVEMSLRGEKNISVFSLKTDEIEEWVEWCIEEFRKRQEKEHYEILMTRSTPPESIQVGLRIKEEFPDVKWIASLADPVANNPYELKAYIDDNPLLSVTRKKLLKIALREDGTEQLSAWEQLPDQNVQLLCRLKRWEDAALAQADLLISPTVTQLRYLLGKRLWKESLFALPHSYDESFYKTDAAGNNQRVTLSFLGYTDRLRSLEPLVQAVMIMKQDNSASLEKLDIRIIGNTPREIKDMVLNYYLDDIIHFSDGVDYYESLELMQKTDWLIHVDAYFKKIRTGGSLFFAGKLADYMGAKKPILALTGTGSPADFIVSHYGGVVFNSCDIEKIAEGLERIADGWKPEINLEYREQYSAKEVAKRFDARVQQLFETNFTFERSEWPAATASEETKLLSVCVPSYNVEKTLDRCLYTLVNHAMAAYMDIMVVNDGSKDHSEMIGRAYEKHYPGIVRVLNKENGGHGSTINTAIRAAKGKYFRVVDGDDWVDSSNLAKLLAQVRDGVIDEDVVSSNYHEVNIESAELRKVEQDFEVDESRIYSFADLDPDETYLTLASMQIKTEILRKMHVKLQEHTFYVDVEFILFPVPYIDSIRFDEKYIYKYARGNAEQSVAIPNMVKRYDHHERVLKRVIAYQNHVQMNKAQTRYYEAILKRLLCTHYFLCLAYDEDKERGCARAEEFDRYLKRKRPDLAKWVGDKLLIVKVARLCHFDAERIEHSAILKMKSAGESVVNRGSLIARSVISSNITKHVVYNPVTLAIAQSPLFTDGIGLELKEKVNMLLGM